MTHLTHEEFVLSYYGEPELGADRREHLDRCEACRGELTALAAVLDRVTPAEVTEPDAGYEARVWDRLQWRLRGERATRRDARSRVLRWTSVAAAAILALAFFATLLWNRRQPPQSVPVAANPHPAAASPAAASTQQQPNRILLVVVGEHFDDSERVLVELANLTPKGNTDITNTRERAGELLVSNRLYRTTALDRGEENVATLLDALEPVLLQLAHAPAQVSAEELRAMQKRVENKGLVFKLRVVRADVHREMRTSTNI